MKNIIAVMLLVAFQYVGLPANATEIRSSARSDRWDNPFLAYGYNPTTKVLTGYLAVHRTAPGRTDQCRLVFKAYANRIAVKYQGEAWVFESQNETDSGVTIVIEGDEPFLKFLKASLGSECDWILPFVVETHVSDTVAVSMKVSDVGNWISVYVINAKRANFHTHPDSASVRKSYLVAGDVIYVYDEQPGWYFVRFENEKTKTAGWIRKADTVQP